MSAIQHERLHVGGLHLSVYNLQHVLSQKNSTGGSNVAVMLLTHGRGEDQSGVRKIAEGVLEKANEQSSSKKRELVVVTLDQRNHGERMVDTKANEAFHKNPRHAADMISVFRGTAKDISYLIDFLPTFLFPADERTVDAWYIGGVSLGGHVTWAVLHDDPRVTLGVPIIGCPDYKALLADRIARHPPKEGPNELVPPVWPKSLDNLVKTFDTAQSDHQSDDPRSNPFIGKKVLVLCGADDRLVPPKFTTPVFERLNVGPDGKKEMVIQEKTGHEVTSEMIRRTAGWVWDHGLTVGDKVNELKSSL